MGVNDDVEMRCIACIQIQCECPEGYFAGEVVCTVCGYLFVLAAARCSPDARCPKCGGSLDQDPD